MDSSLTKLFVVLLGVLYYALCCTAQDIIVASTTITDAATTTFTAGGTAQTISVTLALTLAAGDDGTISKISVYFTNNAQYESSTVKSTAVDETFSTPITVPGDSTDKADLIAEEAVDMLVDVPNCQAYSHVCVVITVTSNNDDASNNDGCLAFGATSTDAGVKKCPDIAAKASTFVITAPTPSSITYDTSTDTAITFEIEATAADGQGTVTGVKLYFTDSDDYDTAQTKSSAFDASGVTSTNVADGATVKITGATASLKLDAANCDDYSHLCAVLQISTTDTITNNNDVCNVYGTTAADAGSKACHATTQQTTTSKGSAAAIAAHSVLVMLLCMVTARLVI